MTPEDEQDLRNVQPFVLQTKDLDKYYIRYLGKETLDEIRCYTFAVKPKAMEKGERYFAGHGLGGRPATCRSSRPTAAAWACTRKNFDNQFPKFETYRQQIDGKYWFPTYTIANDVLMFQHGPQPIKMVVKYEDYKRFGADTTITFGDEAVEGQYAAGDPERTLISDRSGAYRRIPRNTPRPCRGFLWFNKRRL